MLQEVTAHVIVLKRILFVILKQGNLVLLQPLVQTVLMQYNLWKTCEFDNFWHFSIQLFLLIQVICGWYKLSYYWKLLHFFFSVIYSYTFFVSKKRKINWYLYDQTIRKLVVFCPWILMTYQLVSSKKFIYFNSITEILYYIIRYLSSSPKDLMKCRSVCKKLMTICSDEEIWEVACLNLKWQGNFCLGFNSWMSFGVNFVFQ